MKKSPLLALILLTFSSTFPVYAAQTRYISDELSTWVRSGPGNQYRLVGQLNAGEEVTLLTVNNETKYGQIRDASGRTTWIPLAQLSVTPSLRTRVPELEKQVSDLTQKLAGIDSSWNQRTTEMQKKVAGSDRIINALKEENQQLKNQLVVAQKKVSAANVQLDDKQRTIIMQWFMYGGGVAGVGLLLGLLLPHMLPHRKKKDRWMR